jgi:YegS/Rv2252/BmrU family lipid kinase
MTRALIIRNPVSRRRISDARLADVCNVALAAGWQIEMRDTQRAGHATEIARDAAAARIDVVVVHGGDGTINEAVNGLVKTPAALAVLRGGTANVWAKETQCAKDPVASMRAIVDGEHRRVDVGRAGDRHFLLMAGIGLDARIVRRVNPSWKRRLGAAAYIVTGVRTALGSGSTRVRMTLDDAETETWLYWMLIGNTRNYGGVVNITHRAQVDDGQFDVALMRRGGVLRLLVDALRVFLKRHDRSPNVLYTRARSIEITTPGVPVQIDGELHGETPMRFEIVADALEVIVPRGLSSPLFGRAGTPPVP